MKIYSYNGTAINNTIYQAEMLAEAHGIPAVQANMANRSRAWPLLSGVSRGERVLAIELTILDQANLRSRQNALYTLFDTDDETPRQLVIQDDDYTNDRYVLAKTVQLSHKPEGNGRILVAVLVVSGDIRWRSVTQNTNTFSVTASGQTKSVTNNGDDLAYPIITIKPTTAKSTGYAYRRFVPLIWTSDYSGSDYPIRIGPLDTATLVIGAKMQADGDDLRVHANGTQRNRWLVAMNSANTYIWATLNFQAKQEGTITAAIDDLDNVLSITLNEDISDWPTAGLIYMPGGTPGAEIFAYTDKDNYSKTFTGITRATRGTSAADHALGATAQWLQHDLWLLYGNPSITSADISSYPGREPAFDYANSTNAQHDYLNFGAMASGVQTKSLAWIPGSRLDEANVWHNYTSDQYASPKWPSPWAFMGNAINADTTIGEVAYWTLEQPCGVDNVNWQSGKVYHGSSAPSFLFHAGNWPRGGSWWNYHYTLNSSAPADTWNAWSNNSAIAASNTILFSQWFFGKSYTQVSRVTVDLVDAPTHSILAESGGYSLDLHLENTTNGQSFTLALTTELNEEIEVDVENRTVKAVGDGTSHYGALSAATTTTNKFWMTLSPGNNDIVYTDAGTVAVTLDVDYSERYRA